MNRACRLTLNPAIYREFELITLARLLVAQYVYDGAGSAIREAMQLLDRIRQAAEAGGRMGSVIEIGVVQALAHQAQGDLAPALIALEKTRCGWRNRKGTSASSLTRGRRWHARCLPSLHRGSCLPIAGHCWQLLPQAPLKRLHLPTKSIRNGSSLASPRKSLSWSP